MKPKPLEALENLLKQELIKPIKTFKTIRDIASIGQIEIIEKNLKLLDIITKYCDICIQEYPEHNFYRVIIMRKQTNGSIMSCSFETTKEEYDLLKEVLLND